MCMARTHREWATRGYGLNRTSIRLCRRCWRLLRERGEILAPRQERVQIAARDAQRTTQREAVARLERQGRQRERVAAQQRAVRQRLAAEWYATGTSEPYPATETTTNRPIIEEDDIEF